MNITQLQTITDQLDIGSHEINYMKAKIKRVIGTIVGLMAANPVTSRRVCLFKKDWPAGTYGSGATWRLSGNGDMSSILVFYIKHEAVITVMHADGDRVDRIPFAHSQEICSALPYFIKGVAEEFPELEKDWAPFIEAAKNANFDRAVREASRIMSAR